MKNIGGFFRKNRQNAGNGRTPGQTKKKFNLEVYRNVKTAAKAGNVNLCLEQMQIKRGVDPVQAKANAQVCVELVASRQQICALVNSDASALVQNLLDRATPLEAHYLYYGLTAWQNEKVACRLEQGASLEELFADHYRDHAGTVPTHEQILDALNHYHLTPRTINTWKRKLEASKNYLATASALSEEGRCFECIAAMQLYLDRDGQLTMAQAVKQAGEDVAVQAAADAAAKGDMTKEQAKKILILAGIAAVIVGAVLFACGAGELIAAKDVVVGTVVELPEVFATFAHAVNAAGMPIQIWGGVAPEVVSSMVAAAKQKRLIGAVVTAAGAAMAALSAATAELVAKLAVTLAPCYAPNGGTSAKAMDTLADYVKATEPCTAEETTDAEDWDEEEDEDYEDEEEDAYDEEE